MSNWLDLQSHMSVWRDLQEEFYGEALDEAPPREQPEDRPRPLGPLTRLLFTLVSLFLLLVAALATGIMYLGTTCPGWPKGRCQPAEIGEAVAFVLGSWFLWSAVLMTILAMFRRLSKATAAGCVFASLGLVVLLLFAAPL